MFKKAIILIVILLIILAYDYKRVYSLYEKNNDILDKNQFNSIYYTYFEDIYKANNNTYLIVHTKEDYIYHLKKDFKSNLSDDEFEASYLKSKIELYFMDPFNRENQLKYYPIYNSQNKIKGYILLSSGIDKHIDNIFDTKIYENDFYKFKLYGKGFNYFDYYFGRKDIMVSSVFNKDDK